MPHLLETRGLTKNFGGLTAVNDVTVDFEDELTAIIGPNGAGKTTFFNLLCGTLDPSSGEIYFQGEDITSMPPNKVVRKGLSRSFQHAQLFEELTVFENVRIAAQAKKNAYNFWRSHTKLEDTAQRAENILERVGLIDKRVELVKNLSHGEKRSMEIAVAMGSDPAMLLLDEPTSGMSPEATQTIIDLLDDLIRDYPIILIEHKMSVVMSIADRILVLHQGEIIADGKQDEVQKDKRVREVYLGEN